LATRTAPARAKRAAPSAPAPRAARQPPAAKPAAPAAKAVAAAPVVSASKPPKLKAKLVRDSFTMPQADFDLIAGLKERALGFKRPAKKSELLRAGLQVLAGLNDTALRTTLNGLAPLKPGRPKKAD
jgi:hypothetical protein